MRTNGVSFALVAGVVCVVSFSTNVCRGSVSATNITLNVNSTGAKNVAVDDGVQAKSYGHNPTRRGLRTVTTRDEITGNALYVYSGSMYITSRPEISTYTDYSDYSD